MASFSGARRASLCPAISSASGTSRSDTTKRESSREGPREPDESGLRDLVAELLDHVRVALAGRGQHAMELVVVVLRHARALGDDVDHLVIRAVLQDDVVDLHGRIARLQLALRLGADLRDVVA